MATPSKDPKKKRKGLNVGIMPRQRLPFDPSFGIHVILDDGEEECLLSPELIAAAAANKEDSRRRIPLPRASARNTTGPLARIAEKKRKLLLDWIRCKQSYAAVGRQYGLDRHQAKDRIQAILKRLEAILKDSLPDAS
jgi:hypothetical protein